MTPIPDILADALHDGTCLLLVLSGKRKQSRETVDKLTVRPVLLKGEACYQLAAKVAKRETHENLSAAETRERLGKLFGPTFEHCHLFTERADYAVRITSDGEVRIKETPPSRGPAQTAHNRAKNYLIPENVPCPFLIEIGVMTPAGKVRAAKYQKFRQINRFLELVDDVVESLPKDRALFVFDFGCGKSYLTFALYHLLTVIHNRSVELVGLDRDAGVVAKCAKIAERLDFRSLQFHCGEIADFDPGRKIDLAVSLHACDTATDDALAQAVSRQAEVILTVPCCQHELAESIHNETLKPLLRHGILRERFAALTTDSLRASALELSGYKTQVVEFIDMEHTAKNLLIRAVRRDSGQSCSDEETESYRKFKEFLGIERMYLEETMGDDFQNRIAE